MVTNNRIPTPSAAPRGSIQKTFVDARVLSGFTDDGHFEILTKEYLDTLSLQEKLKVQTDAIATRTFVSTLPPMPQNSSIIIRDIVNPHIDAIRNDPLFSQSFGRFPLRFSYVDPASIIALQAWIEPRSDSLPSTEDALLEFALPRKWDVPAEVSFIPPTGPIQILSSNPTLQGLAIELDQTVGKVILGAPKHLNLVQIANFNGRYYLRNGYHRVADAIAAHVKEIPALVIDAFNPNDVALPGNSAFNIGYVMNLPRPPLVGDFHTNAALTTKIRERRYGVIVNFDIKPINIGI